ncbi:F-box/FBD/LRR-repeat protein At3g52680 [Linum perenne]
MKRGKSTAITVAAGEADDRISELPDEILHKILCDITSSKQVAKTSVLSRRWLSLWGSYPDVKFDKAEYGGRHGSIIAAAFQNFVEAWTGKFSLNSQLSMRTLDITIEGVQLEPYRSPPLQRLLKLASARNAESVTIDGGEGIFLPYRVFSNSCAKTLRLFGIIFDLDEYSDFPLSFTSLRTLHLEPIMFDHEQSFTNFVASCPFLETLTIRTIRKMKKLLVSNVPNLKDFSIVFCLCPEEIEIEAPALQTLHLNNSGSVTKLHLIAPQLTYLDIEDYSKLTGGVIRTVISKLQFLKILALYRLEGLGKKLKLSIPTLEVFQLCAECDLEEIELDAGPSMSRFELVIEGQQTFPEKLQKCVISNTIACQWHVDITLPRVYDEGDETDEDDIVYLWSILDSMKSFISKFPQFQTVDFRVRDDPTPDDPSKHRTTINHLKLHTKLLMEADHEGVLEAMFWICQPKFLTLVPDSSISMEFLQILLNIKSSLNSSDEHRVIRYGKWQDQLKDVKIMKGDFNQVVKGREEEMELMDVSKDMVTLLATQKQRLWTLLQSVVAAGIAADNVLSALYFMVLFALAARIPRETSAYSTNEATALAICFTICKAATFVTQSFKIQGCDGYSCHHS